MKLGLVITAAGKSKRFGENKQFTKISGDSIIAKTCMRFSNIHYIDSAIITCQKKDIRKMNDLLTKCHLSYKWKVIEGGDTRALSVKEGVYALSPELNQVMIHDGARPFITENFIYRLIKGSQGADALIPVIPTRDTLKIVENGIVIKTIDRNQIKKVQTPQVFKREILNEAYRKLDITNFTDESGMVESLGIPVKTIEGEIENIKITYPSDLSKSFLE